MRRFPKRSDHYFFCLRVRPDRTKIVTQKTKVESRKFKFGEDVSRGMCKRQRNFDINKSEVKVFRKRMLNASIFRSVSASSFMEQIPLPLTRLPSSPLLLPSSLSPPYLSHFPSIIFPNQDRGLDSRRCELSYS